MITSIKEGKHIKVEVNGKFELLLQELGAIIEAFENEIVKENPTFAFNLGQLLDGFETKMRAIVIKDLENDPNFHSLFTMIKALDSNQH